MARYIAGSLTPGKLGSWFPGFQIFKTRQSHMGVLGEFVLSLVYQHKGFSLGPSHVLLIRNSCCSQHILAGSVEWALFHLSHNRRTFDLIITCSSFGRSFWWSHRMRSHCLNIVSIAQLSPPLSEIMISPMALQYSTEALPIYSIFLKRPFWKMWSESQICGQKPLCSVNTGNIITTAVLPNISQILTTYFRKWPSLEKNGPYGAKKLWNGTKKNFVAPAHILNVFFAKNRTQIGPL